MNCGAMIEFFKMRCSGFALDCERAICSDDVDELDFVMSELDGMRKLLQVGNDDMPLERELLTSYNVASVAFLRAHNRINYDPDTGEPRIKKA